jgi:hypothetical protein
MQKALGRFNSGIGADEDLLELLPELFVDSRALEGPGDSPEPCASSALDRCLRSFGQLFAVLDVGGLFGGEVLDRLDFRSRFGFDLFGLSLRLDNDSRRGLGLRLLTSAKQLEQDSSPGYRACGSHVRAGSIEPAPTLRAHDRAAGSRACYVSIVPAPNETGQRSVWPPRWSWDWAAEAATKIAPNLAVLSIRPHHRLLGRRRADASAHRGRAEEKRSAPSRAPAGKNCRSTRSTAAMVMRDR